MDDNSQRDKHRRKITPLKKNADDDIDTNFSWEEEKLLNLIAEVIVQKTLNASYEQGIALPPVQQRWSKSA